MENNKDEVIYAEDVIEIFDNKITYRVLLNMIRARKIPAFKAGRRYLFSRSEIVARKQKLLCSFMNL